MEKKRCDKFVGVGRQAPSGTIMILAADSQESGWFIDMLLSDEDARRLIRELQDVLSSEVDG